VAIRVCLPGAGRDLAANTANTSLGKDSRGEPRESLTALQGEGEAERRRRTCCERRDPGVCVRVPREGSRETHPLHQAVLEGVVGRRMKGGRGGLVASGGTSGNAGSTSETQKTRTGSARHASRLTALRCPSSISVGERDARKTKNKQQHKKARRSSVPFAARTELTRPRDRAGSR
jgi:hypothetical protein